MLQTWNLHTPTLDIYIHSIHGPALFSHHPKLCEAWRITNVFSLETGHKYTSLNTWLCHHVNQQLCLHMQASSKSANGTTMALKQGQTVQRDISKADRHSRMSIVYELMSIVNALEGHHPRNKDNVFWETCCFSPLFWLNWDWHLISQQINGTTLLVFPYTISDWFTSEYWSRLSVCS